MDHYHCSARVTCVTERRTQMQDELWAIGVGAVASLDPSFPGPLSGILGSATREATHERQKVLRLRRASQLAALVGLNLSEHVKKRLKFAESSSPVVSINISFRTKWLNRVVEIRSSSKLDPPPRSGSVVYRVTVSVRNRI